MTHVFHEVRQALKRVVYRYEYSDEVEEVHDYVNERLWWASIYPPHDHILGDKA